MSERPEERRITFAHGPAGLRAVIAGTGTDVWEVIAAWKASGESYAGLREDYPWLSDAQLRSALAYYGSHAWEIDARLAREAYWTPERAREVLTPPSPQPD